MAVSNTYQAIATTTVSGSSTTSYTFSSIPGTYTDIILVATGSNSVGNRALNMTFNGDSGTNYSATNLAGDGTSAVSNRSTSASNISIGNSATTIATITAHIMNYSNATTYKSVIMRNSASSVQVAALAGLWRSTAAITSIGLTLNSGDSFNAGTTFTIYGIASA
jgi:hypothetical protein